MKEVPDRGVVLPCRAHDDPSPPAPATISENMRPASKTDRCPVRSLMRVNASYANGAFLNSSSIHRGERSDGNRALRPVAALSPALFWRPCVMAGFAVIFLSHHTKKHKSLSQQGWENVFAGHLRKMYANRIAGRTMNRFMKDSHGSWVYLRAVLRRIK